jgi:hypothetical protein
MQTTATLPKDWIPMAAFPPEPCETYVVRLADGAEHRAFWSGKAWWLQGKAITPVGWRSLVALAA